MYLKSYIARTWNNATMPELFYHEEVFYIVKFRTAQDRGGILSSGPYTMTGMPLLLKKWTSAFDFQTEFPSTTLCGLDYITFL